MDNFLLQSFFGRAVLRLHCGTGYSLAVVHGLLTVVGSLLAEHGLWGTWASVAVAPGL